MAGLPRPIKTTLIRPMLVSLRHELGAAVGVGVAHGLGAVP